MGKLFETWSEERSTNTIGRRNHYGTTCDFG